MTAQIALALGSNLGDRHGRLIEAIDRLSAQVEVEDIAPIYETEPWGYADQPKFLNTACIGKTNLSPQNLLAFIKSIEAEMGREATFRNGPRSIDVDIALYADHVIEEADLQIPHARLLERAFVLKPLADIAGEWFHPIAHRSINELANQIDLSGAKIFARQPLRVGDSWWHWGRQTYVMGILNITPDSFSGDGLLKAHDWIETALAQARSMLGAGAHILDVGGESTRPGSQAVSLEAEIDRVVPIIEALKQNGLGPISIDTYKAEVARQSLDAGANMINEVWGLRRDENMAALAAARRVPIVLMHNRSKIEDAAFQAKLGGRYVSSQYTDLIGDITKELRESIELAHQAGVLDRNIILDPGIGFGKTTDQNLELLNRMNEFKVLGFPLLSGPSRKSFIGYTLNLPPEQRVFGTAATVAMSIARGADIVRVHDVAQMAQVAKMTDAMVRRK